MYHPDRLRGSVDTQGSRSNAVAKILNYVFHEEALLNLELDSYVLQNSQNRVQVLQIFVLVAGEHNDIVEVNEAHITSNERQDYVERTLEG